MQTKHYLVENLTDFLENKENVENLRKYLVDIEKIFPVIEEVFGQNWNDNHIHIKLKPIVDNSKKYHGGSNYHCGRDDVHIVETSITNEAIQRKKYPENLWGCLLHETLHAFMNPIIKKGNDLNGGYSELFIKAFHTIVYLKLKYKGEISGSLCSEFLSILKHKFNNDSKKIYKYYIEMFLRNPNNFSKFIARLSLSDIALIRAGSFWQDLEVTEKHLMN